MAIVRPIVECNRTQIENGRTYLKEIVFGDPEEPYHRDALGLTAQTEEAIAEALERTQRAERAEAATLAHIVSAIMFVSMAATVNSGLSLDDVVDDIAKQVCVLLRR